MKYSNTKTIEDIKSSKYFKKADILVFIILICMVIGVIFLALMPVGEKVVIKVNGVVKYTYNLSENREIIISDSGHENVVVIENGYVYMKSSNCPSKDCVNYGKINKVGQIIVCAPHDIIVEILGKSSGVDTVA